MCKHILTSSEVYRYGIEVRNDYTFDRRTFIKLLIWKKGDAMRVCGYVIKRT